MKTIDRIKDSFINRSNESKISYLRKKGVVIGGSTKLLCGVNAFGTEPYLISVGENCLFSNGVKFYTHDGGISVLENLGYFNGIQMDKIARIRVGNNVYIGAGATILPGVTIGDNCIIGAGAVVSKSIPDNSVAVGVPARRIKSINEYYDDAVKKGCLYSTHNMSADEKRLFLLANVDNK